MKKILFPTDFSPSSQHAFVYALHLAHQLGASITTIHSYVKPYVGDFIMPPNLATFYEGLDWNELENYKAEIPTLRKLAISNHVGHVPINHALIEGTPLDAIVKTAKEGSYDYIVMNTDGASAAKELFFGTLAAEVMENAPCPVLVVPHNAVFDGKIDKIGIAVEFSSEDRRVMSIVLPMAHVLKASIEAIHFDFNNTADFDEKMDNFRNMYKKYDQIKYVELPGRDLIEDMADYVETHGIDFLVMVSHKRNFLEELFTFSHAKKMSYQHRTPILAIPAALLYK